MEQREGDPGDLAGLLGRGCCAEGERKEGDGAAGWASLSVPMQGTGSAGERRRLVGLGATEGLWQVGPRSCLRMTALWAWRGGGAGGVSGPCAGLATPAERGVRACWRSRWLG